MSLNGTDIIMLSGFGENDRNYIEQSDGSLGELNGKRRKKRKERKKARKAARKEKRAARRAYRKAKKRGDKAVMKAAKERKKAAKKKLRDNRGGFTKAMRKVGQGIAKFTMKTSLLLPRSMFCLLLRLNFRGLATKLSKNEKARNKFAKLWKKLGGSKKSWQKSIEKGKNKKALFGSKNLKGYPELQLQQLGAVLDEWNYCNMGGATLGEETATNLKKYISPVLVTCMGVAVNLSSKDELMKNLGEETEIQIENGSAPNLALPVSSGDIKLNVEQSEINQTEGIGDLIPSKAPGVRDQFPEPIFGTIGEDVNLL